MATRVRPPPPPKPKTPPKGTTPPQQTDKTTLNGNGIASPPSTSPPPPPSTATPQIAGHTHHSINHSVPPSLDTESVVMTPRGKTANSTIILIERKLIERVGDRQHVAGGDHTGIIINKDALNEQKSDQIAPQLSLEFRVFLVSANTGQHSQESRSLRFWFRSWLTDGDKQAHVAQDFFRELVSPKEFPRDYVGFIKKIMKLLQKGFNEIQALEVELRILEETSAPPSRPPRDGHLIYCYGDCNRKFEQALTASRTSLHSSVVGGGSSKGDTGQDQHNELMKKFWLEIYNRHYKFKLK